jgi:hypothetical protein
MEIIAFSGPQGSGKTTIARSCGYPIYKFADPLYTMHHSIRDILMGLGEPMVGINGALLQLLGTDFGRKELGADIWVRIMRRRLEAAWHMLDVVVIDDVRFLNELELVRDLGGFCVRLDCDEEIRRNRAEKWRVNTGHASETALDGCDIFDLRLDTGALSLARCIEEINHGRRGSSKSGRRSRSA